MLLLCILWILLCLQAVRAVQLSTSYNASVLSAKFNDIGYCRHLAASTYYH